MMTEARKAWKKKSKKNQREVVSNKNEWEGRENEKSEKSLCDCFSCWISIITQQTAWDKNESICHFFSSSISFLFSLFTFSSIFSLSLSLSHENASLRSCDERSLCCAHPVESFSLDQNQFWSSSSSSVPGSASLVRRETETQIEKKKDVSLVPGFCLCSVILASPYSSRKLIRTTVVFKLKSSDLEVSLVILFLKISWLFTNETLSVGLHLLPFLTSLTLSSFSPYILFSFLCDVFLNRWWRVDDDDDDSVWKEKFKHERVILFPVGSFIASRISFLLVSFVFPLFSLLSTRWWIHFRERPQKCKIEWKVTSKGVSLSFCFINILVLILDCMWICNDAHSTSGNSLSMKCEPKNGK